MLRRVAGTLRGILLVLGTVLLVWSVGSTFLVANFQTPAGGTGVQVRSTQGALVIAIGHSITGPYRSDASLGLQRSPGAAPPLWPLVKRERSQFGRLLFVEIPLWLLATFCFAWPVTSLVLARRRRRRRFAVESGDGGS